MADFLRAKMGHETRLAAYLLQLAFGTERADTDGEQIHGTQRFDVLWKIHSRFISETQVRALNALDKRMPRKKAGRLVVSRSFGAKETFMRSLDKVGHAVAQFLRCLLWIGELVGVNAFPAGRILKIYAIQQLTRGKG